MCAASEYELHALQLAGVLLIDLCAMGFEAGYTALFARASVCS